MCLIQSASDPQDPPSRSWYLGVKLDQGPLFSVSSPLSWPAVLTAPPTLINFISLPFCLMSGNSFPTRACTTTVLKGRSSVARSDAGEAGSGRVRTCLESDSEESGFLVKKMGAIQTVLSKRAMSQICV